MAVGFLGIGLGFLLVSSPVLARWATPDDADWSTDKVHYEIQVRKDGTYKVTTESTVSILRDGARSMSNYRLAYNSRASTLKVLLAETINDGKAYRVDSEFIEDKPQASRLHGFDDTNLVVVAFPKVNVGSRLHIKYVTEYKDVPIANHYTSRFDVGQNWYVKEYTAHIVSERPLSVQTNDPKGVLETSQTKKNDEEHEYHFKLKAPLYVRVVDEPWVSVSSKDQTFFVLSTAKSFGELANALAPQYEAVLNADLPPAYRRILEHAKSKTSLVDQLNTITSELADEVRYMGDWRPVKGGHVPRELETIARTKFGDCKDFAASTAAILRRLGVKSSIAWVERGLQPTPLTDTPYLGAFNHAIVWLVSNDGKELWVDPTNFASFAQGMFPDIIDRRAVVVRENSSFLGAIPSGKPLEAVRESLARVALDGKGDASIDASLKFGGRSSAAYTGALLRQSREHLDHMIITSLVDENRLLWQEIDDYDLSSRVTKDFALRVRWGERAYSMRTTVGPAFYLDQHSVDFLVRLETKKRVSDLFLGAPDALRSTEFIENVRMLGKTAPHCELNTPWLRVTRKITQTRRGLKIVDERETKTNLIPASELKSAAFAKFQEALTECFDRVAVVYAPLKPRPFEANSRKLSSEHGRKQGRSDQR